DDVVLVATSAEALQTILGKFVQWCNNNFMTINALKSGIQIHGRRPNPLPVFKVGDETVDYVEIQSYLGLSVSPSHGRHIYQTGYTEKAKKATRVGNMVYAMETMAGIWTPKDAMKLYMALVDAHLIFGCEVMIDSANSWLDDHEDVQKQFIRRALGVNKRSCLVALFTETGVAPIRVRRITLALQYLDYIVSRPETSLVKAALIEATTLQQKGHPNWLADMRTAIAKLPYGITTPTFDTLPNRDQVNGLIKAIWTGLNTYLAASVNGSEKLYLIKGRRDPEDESKPAPVLAMRGYLKVANDKHRKALTRYMLSSHQLAVEALRWVDHARPKINRQWRLCRFCRAKVETPEHAVLECKGDPENNLDTRRQEYLTMVRGENPDLARQIEWSTDISRAFTAAANDQETVGQFARLCYHINSIYNEYAMYIHPTGNAI
ncbi:hypothetical protein BKA70DRAFT_1120066, partial [Coprinopsis sp. MPI-PUGE-AT-0042]